MRRSRFVQPVTEQFPCSDTLKLVGADEMRHFQAVGILLLVALGGCRSSDRTITLEDSQITVEGHKFVPDFLPTTFSRDGRLMAGIDQVENEFQVRDVDTGEIVSQIYSDWDKGLPVLFSADGESLIILDEDEGTSVSLTMPVSGGEMVILHKVSVNESHATAWNYDCTAVAFSHGVVLFSDGRFVVAKGAHKEPFFDQYGAVWYRTDTGWIFVGRDGEVSEHADRPSYLVENQTQHRGSMHLAEEEVTLKRNEASAYVTAVWLDTDKPAPLRGPEVSYDRTALVFVGADVYSAGFVPNRQIIAVGTTEGTAFVPYVVEPWNQVPEQP